MTIPHVPHVFAIPAALVLALGLGLESGADRALEETASSPAPAPPLPAPAGEWSSYCDGLPPGSEVPPNLPECEGAWDLGCVLDEQAAWAACAEAARSDACDGERILDANLAAALTAFDSAMKAAAANYRQCLQTGLPWDCADAYNAEVAAAMAALQLAADIYRVGTDANVSAFNGDIDDCDAGFLLDVLACCDASTRARALEAILDEILEESGRVR